MGVVDDTLTRIGIFYDGNYFSHVSNYYQYYHERRARLSISGLHDFIRDRVSQAENNDTRYCQVVDAHYFRGRLKASEAEDRDLLYKERVFDDVLVREGVTTHYLPLGQGGEKGIDVWLALEAYELAIYKRFNVTVLVTCDGDFLPLIRKLNTLGSRVMLLGWDFKFTDQNGFERETRTAQVLLDEVTYPVMMHQVIDDRAKRSDPLINGLFLPRRDAAVAAQRPASFPAAPAPVIPSANPPASPSGNGLTVYTGVVQSLKTGFGFITPDQSGPNMFFFHLDVEGTDFLDLYVGDRVQYVVGQNDRGPCAKQVRVNADKNGRDELLLPFAEDPEQASPG
ncbi:MAG TPA: NYN domain-containing protein [Gemmataceae bacterium]|nr:NYN domain-containing protein [Gemmataceae bacterium]